MVMEWFIILAVVALFVVPPQALFVLACAGTLLWLTGIM